MGGMQWWIVSISGYGSFAVYGTRKGARVGCDAKAEWEGGNGRVRAANLRNEKDCEMVVTDAKRDVHFVGDGSDEQFQNKEFLPAMQKAAEEFKARGEAHTLREAAFQREVEQMREENRRLLAARSRPSRTTGGEG